MDVLELGCGWGAVTLWIAKNYPRSRVVAVSNSRGHKAFNDAECKRRDLSNVETILADVNEFKASRRFDRIVSVEMFEHMQNFARLMHNIGSWLKSNGKLFVHLFCHKERAYIFSSEGADNWVGRYLFTEGLMPADDLLLHFQRKVILERQWSSLREDGGSVACQLGCVPPAIGACVPVSVSRSNGNALVSSMAAVLLVLRRIVQLSKRPGVVGGSLFI